MKKSFYDYCKNILKKNNIFFIDISDKITCVDKVLRDFVHTTEFGSKTYADIIYREFIRYKKNIILPCNVEKPKFIDIKILRVDKIFKKNFFLKGKAEVVGFLLKVGCHSGIVEVVKDGESLFLNTWDIYCHYNRYKFDITVSVADDVEVKVLQDNFDTSTCRRMVDFEKYNKVLMVESIYYIGEDLKLIGPGLGFIWLAERLFCSVGRLFHSLKFIK